jgi:hypothetical protein
MTGARTGPPGKRQRRPGCSRVALKTQKQITQHSSTSEANFKSVPEVRGLPSAGVTRVQQYCAPVRLPSDPPPPATVKPRPPTGRGLPRYPHHLSGVPCPTTAADRTGASVDCFPIRAAFPFCRRVGIRISTFEVCSWPGPEENLPAPPRRRPPRSEGLRCHRLP